MILAASSLDTCKYNLNISSISHRAHSIISFASMRFAEYTGEISRAYPLRCDGKVMLRFPRLFIVAVRGDGV